MKTVKEYLQDLDTETQKSVSHIIVMKKAGLYESDGDECHDNVGCDPQTANGDCEIIGGKCVWVPDFGE